MSDNQEKYSHRKCNHTIKESRVIKNTYFCCKCGVLEYEKVLYIDNRFYFRYFLSNQMNSTICVN